MTEEGKKGRTERSIGLERSRKKQGGMQAEWSKGQLVGER